MIHNSVSFLTAYRFKMTHLSKWYILGSIIETKIRLVSTCASLKKSLDNLLGLSFSGNISASDCLLKVYKISKKANGIRRGLRGCKKNLF